MCKNKIFVSRKTYIHDDHTFRMFITIFTYISRKFCDLKENYIVLFMDTLLNVNTITKLYINIHYFYRQTAKSVRHLNRSLFLMILQHTNEMLVV